MAYEIEERVFLSENFPRLEMFLETPLRERATTGVNVVMR